MRRCIACPRCNGTGYKLLTGVYADTLALVESCGLEVTGAELAKANGVKPTAMNNRLAALEKVGLLTSRRYGRQRFYRVSVNGIPTRKA